MPKPGKWKPTGSQRAQQLPLPGHLEGGGQGSGQDLEVPQRCHEQRDERAVEQRGEDEAA